MSTNAEEAAYCISRIARATAAAKASTNSCARASHIGMAKAYGKRLATLAQPSDQSTRSEMPDRDAQPSPRHDTAPSGRGTLPRRDDEGGAASHYESSRNWEGKLLQLSASVIALEDVVAAMSAGGSTGQRAVVRDIAVSVAPPLGAAPRRSTGAAQIIEEVAGRGAFFGRVLL